jgi:hypothetical protein
MRLPDTLLLAVTHLFLCRSRERTRECALRAHSVVQLGTRGQLDRIL